jgi:hypothetical protein
MDGDGSEGDEGKVETQGQGNLVEVAAVEEDKTVKLVRVPRFEEYDNDKDFAALVLAELGKSFPPPPPPSGGKQEEEKSEAAAPSTSPPPPPGGKQEEETNEDTPTPTPTPPSPTPGLSLKEKVSVVVENVITALGYCAASVTMGEFGVFLMQFREYAKGKDKETQAPTPSSAKESAKAPSSTPPPEDKAQEDKKTTNALAAHLDAISPFFGKVFTPVGYLVSSFYLGHWGVGLFFFRAWLGLTWRFFFGNAPVVVVEEEEEKASIVLTWGGGKFTSEEEWLAYLRTAGGNEGGNEEERGEE